VEAIGEKLARARSVKGVSVEQAARDTHIARKFIEAMEQEDFDAFPGDAYLLGFLRNYSAYLGLRPEDVVSLYHNIRLQEQPAPIDELLDRRPRSGSVIRIAVLVAALVVVAGIVVLFVTGAISFPERDPNRAARREASAAEPKPTHRCPSSWRISLSSVALPRVTASLCRWTVKMLFSSFSRSASGYPSAAKRDRSGRHRREPLPRSDR
jgi:cytoskeletal protein RodZ